MTTVLETPETRPAGPSEPIVFVASHAALLAAVKATEMAVATRPPLPVLGGVLLESIGGQLVLSATDYEVIVRAQVPTTTCTSGRLLVDHRNLLKKLVALVAGIPAKEAAALTVEIHAATPDVPTLTVDGQTVPLTAYPIEDYLTLPPELPPLVAEVQRDEWLTQLKRVVIAAGKDDTLPMLTAVYVEVAEGGVHMTCTDRFRLTTVRVPAHTHLNPDVPGPTALVYEPTLSKVADLFKKLPDEQVRLGLDPGEGTASFSCGPVSVTTRLMDCKFPSYRQLLPKEQHGHATVDRAALQRQVKRAAALAKEADDTTGTLVVQLRPAGVSVRAQLTERDDQAKVPFLHATVVDCDREVWFHHKYLLDALAAFSGDTIALFPGGKESGPVLLFDNPDDWGADTAYMHLLMPLRQSEKPQGTK